MSFFDSGGLRASVDFSPDLARLLGYRSDERYMYNAVTGPHSPNLVSNIRSVYVYCDLLEHVPVGDTKAPVVE